MSYGRKADGQEQSIPPYPYGSVPPEATPAQVSALMAFLNDPSCILPNGAMTSLAAACQDVTRISGKLTSILNTASAAVVLTQAIKRNTPGLALAITDAALTGAMNAAGYNTNSVVGSAIQRAQELVSTPMQFMEKMFRAISHAQASFTMGGIADVFGALNAVSGVITAARTLTDLLTGGVTAQLGPNNPNTLANQRFAAHGISITPEHIRQGLSSLSQAMRNLGTLWDPNDTANIGTPAGLILSLKAQGIAEKAGLRQALLNNGVFLDDDSNIENINPDILLNALREIHGQLLQFIVQQTRVKVAQPLKLQTAADLCDPFILLTQDAIDNIPYGDIAHFGQAIVSMGLTQRVMWADIADALDSLDLPDVGLIEHPTFASDMGNLKNSLGPGSGLFNTPGLNDLIGTAAGAVHKDAFEALVNANAVLEQTPEGKNLHTALDYYNLHSNPSDQNYDVAVNNLVAALDAVGNSSSPIVQQAVADSNKSMFDSAQQLVNEITSAVATGYAIYSTIRSIAAVATVVGQTISSSAKSLGSDSGSLNKPTMNAALLEATKPSEGFWFYAMMGLKSAWSLVNQLTDAIGNSPEILGMLESVVNRNSKGGQSILALIAETKNKAVLNKLGIQIPKVDIENHAALVRAKSGYGLTLDQLNIITAYANNHSLGEQGLVDLLTVNSYFGYQRHWFETFAGLYEQGYVPPAASSTGGTISSYTELYSYTVVNLQVANLVSFTTLTTSTDSSLVVGSPVRIFPTGYTDRYMTGYISSYTNYTLLANVTQSFVPNDIGTGVSYGSWLITGQ